jgi:plasmid replication initiation protein
MKRGVTMSKLFVKDNSLINASYHLDLVEQRLILLSIIEARLSGKGINANEPLTIHAESYAKHFGVTRQAAYLALKEACKNLFERRFSYRERRERGQINITTRWVSQIGYLDDKAMVELIFSPAVVPLITKLEEQFTKYDIEQVSNLSSAYAIRLYELLICWRNQSKTPIIELKEFRKKMGILDNEYEHMHDFKSRVLDIAILQINKHTDINVSYEQYKQGRVITGFSFTFKQKNTTENKKTKSKKGEDLAKNTNNEIKPSSSWQTKGLSEAQIKKIACKLKEFVDANGDKISSNDHRGYAQIFSDWKVLLKDPKNINSFKKVQEFLEC